MAKTLGFHCRMKRGKAYNQQYSTQKGSRSDLVEKSKALHRIQKKLREFSTTKPTL